MDSSSNAAGGGASSLAALSDDLAGAVERAGRSVVAIHARRRIPASGVHWRDGIIVGANHTIHLDEDITVALPDGSTVTASVAGRDPTTDLAILRVPAGALAVAERGGSGGTDDLRVGALVLALGRPGPSITASMGIVSAVGGEWRTWHGGRIDRFVRLDLAVYDGFSGGPLVSAAGRVLGIDSSGLSRASAIAIPASTVDRVVDELAARGHVARGYVGVAMQPVRLPEQASRGGDADADIGLMVVSVERGGPADAAGILLGDVLIDVDGTPVRDPAELLALLGPDRIGREVRARVLRAGAVREIGITIGERPRADAPPQRRRGRGGGR
jgi:S1-C subfamily serine protease